MIQSKNIFGWLLLIMLLSSVGAKAEGENVTFDTSSSGKAYLSATEAMNASATDINVTINSTSGAEFYVVLKDWDDVSTHQDIASVTATVYVGGASAQARRRAPGDPDAPGVVSVIQGSSIAAKEANGYNDYNIYKVTLPATLSTLTNPTIEVHVTLQDKVDLNSENTGITLGSLTYNGSEQHPSVTVTYSSTELTEDQHYTVAWPAASTNAGDSYTATITGCVGSHYYNSKTATYTINQLVAELNWTNTTLTFTGSAQAPTCTVNNIISPDVCTVTVSGAETNVGNNYTATATELSNANYKLPTTTTQAFSITAASATITADATQSTTYNGSPQPLTASADAGGVTITYYTNSGHTTGETTTAPTNAGTYYAVVTQSNTNYTSTPVNVTYTINPKTVIVSGITASNKTYDGNTTATLVYPTLTDKVGSDNLSVTATGTFDNANVGEDKTVTISNLTLGGTSASNYVLAASGQQASTTANITQKTVTVSGITASDKTFDGNTTATLVYTGATFAGIVEGDNLTVTATGAFDNANVGAGKTVTISGLTLGGTSASNYVLAASGQQASTTANITQKTVTVNGITASNKTYDGNTTATLVYTGVSFAGIVGEDNLTVTATGTFDNANVGAGKTVTISGLTLGGTSVGNYILATSGQQASTTADITQKAVTVGGITASDKTFDGNTTATLVYTGATFAGIVEGDNLTVTATGAFDNANVGAGKTVTISGLTLGGTSASNYTLAATGNQTEATATISVANLTITAIDQTIAFGGSIATTLDKVTTSGLVTDDELTAITLTPSTSDVTTSGTITPSAASTTKGAGNYSITYNPGNLTITAVAASVTTPPAAVSGALTYSGAAQELVTAGTGVIGGTLKYYVSTTNTTPATTAVGWTSTVPTGINAETYYVWYYVDGDANHSSTAVTAISEGSKVITPKTLTTDMVTPATLDDGTWTGSAQSFPAITVADGTIMTANDYTITWINTSVPTTTLTNFTDCGTYRATITGQNNYIGSVTRDFAVGATTISGMTVNLASSTAKFAWDGTANTAKDQKPAVTITSLTEDTDFEVAWKKKVGTEWNATTAVDVVGTYKAVVTGKGNYKDTAESGEFTITAKPLSDTDIEVMAIANATYSGAAQNPASDITLKIKEGSSYIYTLTSADIASIGWDDTGLTNVGTYTATITGQGNFTGTTTASYTIAPKALANNMITLSATSAAWTGNAENFPTFTVVDADIAGNPTATDYTYKWVKQGETTELTTFTDRGVYELQLTGQGNYTGSATKTFTVGSQNIEGATFTFTPASAIYKENASHVATDQTPAFTVEKDGNTLDATTDYDTKWQKQDGSNWVDLSATETVALPGIYRVNITGKGDYASTTSSQSFEVSKYTLSDAEVTVTESGISTLSYDGAAHMPVVIVKVTHDATEVTLREGTDYTITYPDGCDATSTYKAIGSSTFTITGAGNYTGGGSATFTIQPRNYDLAFAGSGKWATFYNDEQVKLSRGGTASGLTAYYVTAVSATSVTVEEIVGDVIPAQMPVLLNRGTSPATSFECEIIGDDATGSDAGLATFVGVGTATNISRGSYILVNDAFVRSDAGTLPANRCYLTGVGSSGARMRTIVVNDGNTTAIETIETEDETDSTDQWYTMDGRRISKPLKKGLYIKNNKKVVIK